MASEGTEAKSYSTDPALYIYTSLTAGSSHIVTATSRLETILRANRVPFKAIDIATDEKARMLWGRRAGKDANGRQRKLPGLVQMGMVLGDLVEIEEWNEYGELKEHVTFYYDEFTQPPISQAPKPTPAAAAASKPAAPPAAPAPVPPPAPSPRTPTTANTTTTLPVRSIAEEAAAKAKQVHLQSLRDKVHGKASASAPASPPRKQPTPSQSKATTNTPATSTSTSTSTSTPTTTTSEAKATETAAVLQSPRSSGWKGPGADMGSATTLLQSPRSTGWKPADVEAPVTELHGSVVARASAEEIAAVERAETIREEPDKEEEEEEEEDGDEESEEEDENEEESEEDEDDEEERGEETAKGEGKGK